MNRRAMTLVELLVVIIILTLVTAATVPMMTMGTSERRTREAARFVTSQIQAAQTKAIASGQPYGVMFERERTNPNVCVTISQAHIPANYTGYSNQSACLVVADETVTIDNPRFKARFYNDPWVEKFVKRGDRISLGVSSGRTWLITSIYVRQTQTQKPIEYVEIDLGDPRPNTGGPLVLSPRMGPDQLMDTPDDDWGIDFQPFTDDDPVTGSETFKIFRQPERTSDLPVTLPGGACIDLAHSGTETSPSTFASPINTSLPGSIKHEPVIIMFNGSGDIQSLQDGYNSGIRTVERTYFLIGKPENVPLPGPGVTNPWALVATDEQLVPNWQDLENYWVSISFTNTFTAPGRVAYVDPATFTTTNLTINSRLSDSRRLVREGEVVTGR